MFKYLAVAMSLIAAPALAQVTVEDWKSDPTAPVHAQDVNLDDFRWQARTLVIFADTPLDPAFGEQLDLLSQEPWELIERDLLIVVDTDPASPSDLRTTLRPRGFMWVLIGKDGQVELRKPFAWDIRELTRVIDKMPLRKQEIENR